MDKTTFKDARHYENVKKYLLKNMENNEAELKGRKGYLSSFNAKRNIRVCSWKEEHSEDYAHWSNVIVERGNGSAKLLHTSERTTGVIRETVDTNTGEIYEDIIPNAELDDELKELGYRKLITRTEVYLSRGSNDDVFPAPQFAVRKQQKKKRKKKRAAKKK